MTRAAVLFDRVVVALAGIGVVAIGLLAVGWHQGVVGGGRALRLAVADPTRASWWPWALLGAGVVLALLALRWLGTHRWEPKAHRVSLPGGSDGHAILTADAASVANAAASALEQEAVVTKADGTATIHRGTPTITLTAKVPARQGLAAGIRAAEEVADGAAVMLEDTVAIRTILKVDTKAGPAVR